MAKTSARYEEYKFIKTQTMSEEITEAKMKYLEVLTGSVISNFVALHYLEELKGKDLIKHKAKNLVNKTIKTLQGLEQKEFDLLFENNSDILHYTSDNIISFISEIMKTGFSNQIILQNIIQAYNKNPKAIEGIVNKILNK